MLPSLKVAFLRRYYRFANWRAWQAPKVHDAPGAPELPGAALCLRVRRARQ